MSFIRPLFLIWYSIGLLMMLTTGVPDFLAFSNGLFLLWFALYAIYLERELDSGLRDRAIAISRWRRIAFLAIAAFLVEWIGVKTAFPFGDYSYTAVLGIRVGGVPLAIACAWVGILLTAMLLIPRGPLWLRALQAGGWMILFDLVLDPVAYERGFWLWESNGFYYGVPYTNFAGWFLFSALLSLLFPSRTVPYKLRQEAGRLMQLMLLFFGLLSLKDGLIGPAAIALCGLLLAEGAIRIDSSRQAKLV